MPRDTIDASSVDAVAAVHEVTGPGADHVFEVVGRPALVRQAFDMAAPGRTAYVVGIQSDDAELTLPVTGFRRGKKVVGVFMGDTDPASTSRVRRALAVGQLDLGGLISHTFRSKRSTRLRHDAVGESPAPSSSSKEDLSTNDVVPMNALGAAQRVAEAAIRHDRTAACIAVATRREPI